MLEKQKEWLKEKGKKGKEIVKKEKGNICFGLGMAAMAGIYLIFEKINEPKMGNIFFDKEAAEDNNIVARVYCSNRFGREKNVISLVFGSETAKEDLKNTCDKLNKLVYPGD